VILVDSRIGSKELFPLFPKGQAQLTTLPFGDFSFIGKGPEGIPVMIGIERKTIREIAGTISDGRLVGHQIPGLVKHYGVVYLVVEGVWRGHRTTGILRELHTGLWRDIQNGPVRFMANDIRKFLYTLENMAGVRLRYTPTMEDTAQEVLALHSWWTNKEWAEHRAHIAIQYPPVDILMFRKPSLMQYWAACLPGVGWKRSRAVEQHFPGIIDMVLSNESEWEKVEGIGKVTARKVVEAINWRKEGG
jgi:ERCC4-type nuclease